ncbi:dihydrolipoyl dehydrogenase [Aeromicrobium camelliae]|uniref:Dihydrolipoyl dehydrogenase n=1 Tax=Aeromicrobium camelliae TaxID=1538144 RepID=A0A3N6WN32_9ACTN|nr:dihydrolipoyl dehydrogenase [Aeromicrobium camelliae]RQN02753.1 dihydrolipoyl dehydrogenase [Aeromicrobium camelliae]
MTDDVDIVVLGGGSAGYACALRASQLGLSVVLIDRDRLGGTCLHRGCIPTKALLHVAELADHAREAPDLGVMMEVRDIDLDRVHDYKDAVVERLARGLEALVASRGIEVVAGVGRLVGPGEIEVDGRRITGRHVVLATGGRPKQVRGIDIDGQHVLTSDDALELDRIPESVIVLGGGVIGCEFASLWRSLGAEVTIVEAQAHLLPTEDATASKHLERAFRRRGITFKLSSLVDKVERTADGVRVVLASGTELDATALLVAVGREAVVDGYADVGVTVKDGLVVTDKRLRTSLPDVFAIGDLVAGPQLAHRGYAHGIFVAEEIAGLAPTPVRDEGVPRVTFTQPEVAAVGLTEAAARAAYGDDVECVSYDLSGNGRSLILGSGGVVKLVRRRGGPVVGVHVVAARAGEMIGEAQLITNLELSPDEVARLVHAHPTQHESLGEAHQALVGRALHGH